MNKRNKGKIYEEKAKIYLENIGVRVLVMNFQGSFGEIDIIGYDDTEKIYLLGHHKKR